MHVYEVMAEPVRRRIVEILASGEHIVGDLEAIVMLEFGVGRSAVQHHLRLLRDHDFVEINDDWPNRWYRLNDDFVALLTREVKSLKRRWNRRIGWREPTESLPTRYRPSTRGYRGHGTDPDDPWRSPASRAGQKYSGRSTPFSPPQA
ncbi:metalloregulator ArsR/SmtB family transcription factor [Frigoribacterium sp. CG_9.8]|uniref:ArsR/SmtB family transcription factor n=1 Tax=Frigoribacterium sp. CG_9.8 TaxID=2787733 RepID=UPI0018CA9CDE